MKIKISDETMEQVVQMIESSQRDFLVEMVNSERWIFSAEDWDLQSDLPIIDMDERAIKDTMLRILRQEAHVEILDWLDRLGGIRVIMEDEEGHKKQHLGRGKYEMFIELINAIKAKEVKTPLVVAADGSKIFDIDGELLLNLGIGAVMIQKVFQLFELEVDVVAMHMDDEVEDDDK